jgi:hypothetical protein
VGCLNFSNPFKASKWLSLIAEQPNGLKLKSNLGLNKRFLGFTFNSNALGYRGPHNTKNGKFILGTSYGMGFGVDTDKCWYKYGDFESWCNISFPTGIDFLVEEIDELAKGNKNTLLILYHPNIWRLVYDNYSAKTLGKSIFEYYNWNLSPRFLDRLHRKFLKSLVLNRLFNYTRKFNLFFNPNYAYFDYQNNLEIVEYVRGLLEDQRKNFQEIILIRLPTKESILVDNRLENLQANYDFMWSIFVDFAKADKVMEPSMFEPKDYHRCDTHWNEIGNQKFAEYLNAIL